MAQPDAALRRLLIGQVPADFTDWLDFVAIGALLAYTWSVAPIVFACLAVGLGIPYLVIGPFAGVIVDRCDTRRVLILSNVGRGLVTTAFFLAPNWQFLIALIALRSAVDTFSTPAKQSAIQALAKTGQRTQANAFSHGINQGAKVIAPSLGGVFLIWLAPHSIFLLNALISFVAAAVLAGLPEMRADRVDDEESVGAMAQIRRGLDLFAQKAALRGAIILMAAGYFAMFFYDTRVS